MRRTLITAAAMFGAAALTLAGCAEAPGTGGASSAPPTTSASASSSASAQGAAFKACMVSDSGGFDDKSFNQTSYKGLTDAKDAAGHRDRRGRVHRRPDYAKNIQSMVDAECNIIVTVGFLLGDDTLAAAKKNTDDQVRHRRLQRPEDLPGGQEPEAAGLQHRPVELPGRLPRRRHVPDREGRHLRRRSRSRP